MSREYHYWQAVSAAETAAKIAGCLLVPAACLHWERKQAFRDRRIRIYKQTFYVLSWDEMTKIERIKYQEALQGEEEARSSDAPMRR